MAHNALSLAQNRLGDLIGSEHQQSLKIRLLLFEESIVLTKYPDGQSVSTYEVSADDLAAAFSGVPLTTGLLPPNCIFYGRRGSAETVGIYLPPDQRELSVDGDRAYETPLPGLVFCGHGAEYRVFAVKERPALGDDRVKLFNAPLPNVHSSGEICSGNVTFPLCSAETIHRAADLFFASAFNRDLVNGKSREHENILAVWRAIEGSDEYPLDDLVDNRTFLSDLWERQ